MSSRGPYDDAYLCSTKVLEKFEDLQKCVLERFFYKKIVWPQTLAFTVALLEQIPGSFPGNFPKRNPIKNPIF